MVNQHDVMIVNAVAVDFARNVTTVAGNETRLEPKLAQLLRYFLDRRQKTLTRDQIIDDIWNGAAGADQSLTNAVSQLRKLLTAARPDAAVIETIPKVGYRFVASVKAPDEAEGIMAHAAERPATRSALPIRQRPKLWAAMGAAALLAIIGFLVNHISAGRANAPINGSLREGSAPVLAVVPFTADASMATLAFPVDGFSLDLTETLIGAKDLDVIAPESAFQFRESNAKLVEIDERLGATHFIDGRIEQTPEGVVVSARLVEASNGYEIWSRRYSSDLDGLGQVRERISQDVAKAFSVSPTAERRSRTSEAVYERYLRGVVKQREGAAGSLLQAKALFEEAIRDEPQFAEAHARLAQVYLSLGAEIGGVETISPDAAAAHAEPHIEKALSLTPTGAEALEAQWRLQLSRNNCVDAEETLMTTLDHYPSNAAAQYSLYQALCCQGKWLAAYEAARRASILDPFNDQYAMDRASTLILLDDYDGAKEIWRRILEQHPNKSTGYRGLGHFHRFSGELAKAQQWYTQALDVNSGLIWNKLYAARNLTDMGLMKEAIALYPENHRWELHYAAGDFDTALAALADEEGDPVEEGDIDELAEIYAAAGRFDQARALLEIYAERSPGTTGPLFADFPELDIPAPLLVHLRRAAGDEAGAAELSARAELFIDAYRDGGGDDYLLNVIEARLAAATGDGDAAARWLRRAVDRGFRIRRAHYFPEFTSIDHGGLRQELARMDALAAADRRRFLESIAAAQNE